MNAQANVSAGTRPATDRAAGVRRDPSEAASVAEGPAALRCATRPPTAASVSARLAATVFASAAALVVGPVPAVADPSAAPFRTRLATFEPQPWEALPGWTQESHAEAFTVFVDACAGLQRRPVWQSPCERARALGPIDATGARRFFEDTFVAHRLTPAVERDPALLTGYFEPVLQGALVRGGRFVHPVLGAPSDLLTLDARRLREPRPAAPLLATVSGRDVIPLAPGEAAPAAERTWRVDPDALADDALDRRIRLRADGDRLVRYWSRADIDAGRAAAAPIAWVEDAEALYVMQVQGSGRIRLPDGRMLHLAYGEQNGHPFRPAGPPADGTRTRGLGPAADEPPPGTTVGAAARSLVATDREVQRVIDALLAQPGARASGAGAALRPGSGGAQAGASAGASGAGGLGAGGTVGAPTAPAGASAAGAAGRPLPRPADPGAPITPMRASLSDAQLARVVAARTSDPSYVFFRQVPAQGRGPVGALGIPLTATRSIAVDPRVTPLGAPVFIESERRAGDAPLRRLMFAQDTGGAIRGAVRGDFFWGTGPEAGREAFRTRDALSMWVLLPRGFAQVFAGTRTRSVGGAAAEPECTVQDEDYC